MSGYDTEGPFARAPYSLLDADPPFSLKAKMAFIALRFHAGSKNKCWPPYDDLIRVSSLKKTALAEGLNELEIRGWLIRRRRWNKSTEYTLFVPPFARHTNDDGSSGERSSSATRTLTRFSKQDGTIVAPGVDPDAPVDDLGG